MPYYQAPSATEATVHLVSKSHCTCPGFQYRSRCSHVRRFNAYPARFVPRGEPLGGVWVIGCDHERYLHAFDTLLDEFHIHVVVDTVTEDQDLAAQLAQGGILYSSMVNRGNGEPAQQRRAAIFRMGQRQRVAVLISGDSEWRQVVDPTA